MSEKRPSLLLVGAIALLSAIPLSLRAQSTRELEFTNGDIRLAGRLYLPEGEGPFPAVIFTHGSGDAGRDNPRYREEAEYFRTRGIASFVYDKRGYGASTGDWRRASFEELAEDALAALRALRSVDAVDPDHIGFRGASQSGWVLPLAASRTPDLAFLILISPAGVSVRDQILYDARTDLEDAGYSPPEVERGLGVTRSAMAYAAGEKDWEAHQRVLDRARGEPWLQTAAGPTSPDHWLWSWARPLLDFEAVPIVRRLELPILVLLGEQDREVPSQVAGYRLEKALSAGDGPYLVRYFPEGAHDLRIAARPEDSDPSPLVDGYLTTMTRWIEHHTAGPDG